MGMPGTVGHDSSRAGSRDACKIVTRDRAWAQELGGKKRRKLATWPRLTPPPLVYAVEADNVALLRQPNQGQQDVELVAVQ